MPERKENATLKQIALRLGLNVGTVSRALNRSPRVKEATRELVLKTAAELRYKPNKSARNLVRGKPSNRFIAVLMPNIIHHFYLGILKGIIDELDSASFNVMVFTLKGNRQEVIARILDETPDGLLVFARELAEEERAALIERRIPYLYVDYLSKRDPCVFFDNYQGGRIAAFHLLERRVRSPLYVGLTAQSQQQELRFRGFSDVLAEHDIQGFEVRYIARNEEQAALVAAEALDAGNCDGIFFYCDELAYGGLKVTKEKGIAVPMIGYDDLHSSALLGLTTIRQNAEEMGTICARGITEMREHEDDPGRETSLLHRMMEPVLVIRGT